MSNSTLFFGEIHEEQRVLAGGKGGSLARLAQAGLPVPAGFVVLPSAFNGEGLVPEAWTEVQAHLSRLREMDPERSFAVRSSALGEDSDAASYAGEFETMLNLQSEEEIRQAIRAVYGSRKNERVQAYRQVKGLDEAQEMAIIVQLLVPADRSGILFTANPITGQRDQLMLTATWGLGEAIVGGSVTPDTIVIDKHTGRVMAREIADKLVMTVQCEGGTIEKPVPPEKRLAAVLSDLEISELAHLGAQVESLYGKPMDIEWATCQEKIFLLQARPITALPEPEPPAPTQWKLPKGQYAAMRNNIVELMPNPLTPLFDTLGRGAINASLERFLTRFIGKPDVLADEIIISVNGYAYNNGSVSPIKAMGLVLDVVGILKRMFTGAVERWTEIGRPQYMAAIQEQQAKPWRESSSTGLVKASQNLYESVIDAYGSLLSGAIPAAWISEALFTTYYNLLIKRRGDPQAQAFLLGFDSLPIRAEKDLYELASEVRSHPGLAAILVRIPASKLAALLARDQVPDGIDVGDWQAWQGRFRAHLQSYGHTIYDLDFYNPVPADEPTPLLETLQLYISGQGVDPQARQTAAIEKRERATRDITGRLKGQRLRTFTHWLARAQRYAPLREDGLADVGMGYPLLRQMLRELGRRMTEGGLIEQPDDIFWLTQEEVVLAAARLDNGEDLSPVGRTVPQRKAAWRAAKKAAPPMMLPQMKLFGVDLAGLKSRRARKSKGNILKGVAASAGSITAQACVLHGPEDFSKMETGKILVAAITTPAWTPLFARAAAVVTDVGGPLSHGSIVAREYGIPAVLGTGVATQRIRDGQMLTVDGGKGTVLLHEG